MPSRGLKPDLARRHALLATLSGAATLVTAACSRVATAPDLAFTLLDGSRSSFAALRGQVVLVRFWATQCAPCVAAMPGLVALHRALQPRGLQTLAVAMQYDPPAAVSQFAQDRGLPFGVVIDNTGALARGFGDVQATPTTVLLDRAGRVRWQFEGKADTTRLRAQLEALL